MMYPKLTHCFDSIGLCALRLDSLFFFTSLGIILKAIKEDVLSQWSEISNFRKGFFWGRCKQTNKQTKLQFVVWFLPRDKILLKHCFWQEFPI